MKIDRYIARNNSRTRRQRRAVEAVLFLIVVCSSCVAALAVCGAIIGAGL